MAPPIPSLGGTSPDSPASATPSASPLPLALCAWPSTLLSICTPTSRCRHASMAA